MLQTLSAPPNIADLYRHFPTARTNSGIPFINIADEYINRPPFTNPGMPPKATPPPSHHPLPPPPPNTPILETGVSAALPTNSLPYSRARHGVTNPFINCDRWQF